MRLVQETYHDRQGEEALTYLYESNSYVPLARIDQAAPAANDDDARDTVYYFHNDVSGLPEELTDVDGELVWQARYKVWGNAVQEEWIARAPQRPGPAWGELQAAAPVPTHVPRPQNLRFQGQYLDRETGLHYNTFRFYDPDIDRFINPDPISLHGGINLYQHAPNPISWVDPWGLTPCLGLPSTRKSSGTGSSYDRVNGQGLYVLHDGQNILYVGRGDAPSRLGIHANTPGKSQLMRLNIFDNNLTKSEAKFLEQKIMGLNGGAQSDNPLTNLLNQIRSYSQKNPNASAYDVAGHSAEWRQQILSDTLSVLQGR
nr:RHS repeat-associated core domain-containing protein [Burkholderia sp. Ac-20349]